MTALEVANFPSLRCVTPLGTQGKAVSGSPGHGATFICIPVVVAALPSPRVPHRHSQVFPSPSLWPHGSPLSQCQVRGEWLPVMMAEIRP